MSIARPSASPVLGCHSGIPADNENNPSTNKRQSELLRQCFEQYLRSWGREGGSRYARPCDCRGGVRNDPYDNDYSDDYSDDDYSDDNQRIPWGHEKRIFFPVPTKPVWTVFSDMYDKNEDFRRFVVGMEQRLDYSNWGAYNRGPYGLQPR